MNTSLGEINNRYIESYKRRVNEKEDPIETEEEWESRKKDLEKEHERELTEMLPSEDTFYQFELAFKCLEVLGDMFGQKQKITQQNFEEAAWPKVKQELARILISNGCDLGTLFLPPNLKEEL